MTRPLASQNVSSSSSASSSQPKKASGGQYHTCPVLEWSTQQVCHWLLASNLDKYTKEFMAKGVDGQQLLQLDGTKLKALGVISANDRTTLKKKVKDLKTALEKERKQQEREQKARDKLEKQASGKRKKFVFGK
ncbi:Sterile alpha motif domain-containing protein 14 [Lamellibrachia satsuma]|nr:Sterile alpha motif domain-containing protein 14 [Lamellibrachia satsuma]